MGLLMLRTASHLTIVLLVVLATVGMTLQAASVPHLHGGSSGPGLYNEEHDLTLLASLAAHVTLGQAAPAFTADPSTGATVPASSPHRALRLPHAADSRAPPVR